METFSEYARRMLTKKEKYDIISPKKNVCNGKTHGKEQKKLMAVKFLANYLIQKFWNTRIDGQRIKCTRTKIGKLLTIVQILSLKCNQQMAFDDIIAEETCGTSIPALSVLRYPYDIWELSTNKMSNDTVFFEENHPIDLKDIKNVDESLPELYAPLDDVNESLRKMIDDVFIEFGAFDAYDFGMLMNQFKINICSNGVFSKEKVISWLEQMNTRSDNLIVSFILKYTL